MRRAGRWLLPSAGLLVLVLIAGCGTPTGQVQGQITWQQQPVAGAELQFQAVDDADMQFVGLSGQDGQYQVSYRTFDGLPLGQYKVTITRYTLPGGRPLPLGEEGDVLKGEGVAKAETYQFQSTIAAGANSLNYELTLGQRVTQAEDAP